MNTLSKIRLAGGESQCPYPADKARIVVQEMTDQLVLDLVEHGLVTDQIVLTVGYDIENLTDPVRAKRYHGCPIIWTKKREKRAGFCWM